MPFAPCLAISSSWPFLSLYKTDRILHHSPYGHTSTLESILRHAILAKYYAALSYISLSKISKLACPEQLGKQFMKFLRPAPQSSTMRYCILKACRLQIHSSTYLQYIRSSQVVRASDSQCRNSPGFGSSILRHSGI